MKKMIGRRLLLAIPTLFFMSILTFVLVDLIPGDAAVAILGDNAPADRLELLREELNLNDPVLFQYWHWLSELVTTSSLGKSVISREPVTNLLNARLSVTMALVLGTVIVSTAVGVALGAFSAFRGGVAGRVVDVISFIGGALPAFWIALLLVVLFAVQLRWLPANGYVPFSVSPLSWAIFMILPIVALSIQGFTSTAVQSRDQLKDVLSRDFVRVLVANGFSFNSIFFKHVLRNASPVILTTVGLLFVGLTSGSVLMEVVFSLPGLGQQVVWATIGSDIPVIQGAVLYFTVITLVVNLVIDLLYSIVDPRVRVE